MGCQGCGVVNLWGPPLLPSDLNSWCLALCVRFIVPDTAVLAVLESVVLEVQCGTQSVTLPFLGQVPRVESSTSLVSVMGKHQFQSVTTHYRLDNGSFTLFNCLVFFLTILTNFLSVIFSFVLPLLKQKKNKQKKQVLTSLHFTELR